MDVDKTLTGINLPDQCRSIRRVYFLQEACIAYRTIRLFRRLIAGYIMTMPGRRDERSAFPKVQEAAKGLLLSRVLLPQHLARSGIDQFQLQVAEAR